MIPAKNCAGNGADLPDFPEVLAQVKRDADRAKEAETAAAWLNYVAELMRRFPRVRAAWRAAQEAAE